MDAALLKSLIDLGSTVVVVALFLFAFQKFLASNSKRDEISERQNDKLIELHDRNMTAFKELTNSCHEVQIESIKTIEGLKQTIEDKNKE